MCMQKVLSCAAVSIKVADTNYCETSKPDTGFAQQECGVWASGVVCLCWCLLCCCDYISTKFCCCEQAAYRLPAKQIQRTSGVRAGAAVCKRCTLHVQLQLQLTCAGKGRCPTACASASITRS
jgi:hypothetical protein